MEVRLHEYEQFRDNVAAITAALPEPGGSHRHKALAAAPALRALLRSGSWTEAERAEAVAQAETIRAAAQALEAHALPLQGPGAGAAAGLPSHPGRSLLGAGRGRGAGGRALGRALGEVAAAVAPSRAYRPLADGRPRPPAAARRRWRRRAGAAAALVQFEDGGVMPLPLVRWSEAVRNVHPADAPPHPHGLRYRA